MSVTHSRGTVEGLVAIQTNISDPVFNLSTIDFYQTNMHACCLTHDTSWCRSRLPCTGVLLLDQDFRDSLGTGDMAD